MTKLQTIVLTFLLGALLGGVVAKPVRAERYDVSDVVHAIDRVVNELAEIRRGGLKCHE